MSNKIANILTILFFVLVCDFLVAQDNLLKPYDGPSVKGVDTSTLNNKVMTGYQGWFNCEGDGANLGWTHWSRNRKQQFGPGNITVDLWPDMSELDADERYATGFKFANGKTADVFSSYNEKTVLRHFKWMQEYGIDGAFVQRFASGLRDPRKQHHKNAVLSHARKGANISGRAYAVMYDLSGLRSGEVDKVRLDWQLLQSKMKITKDPAYLHHEGKPVIAVWGVGFNDDRKYTIDECNALVQYLKEQGCTVMLGVPTGWRNLDRDSIRDAKLHEVIKLADIISPWTIGRYRNPKEVTRHADIIWQPDNLWCQQNNIDYLPVVFPGFSWFNLQGEKFDAIPRLKGKFLWSQVVAAKQSDCNMLYIAMFDEVDEGTAIYKCTNSPPVSKGARFLTYEGLPSDYYLRLSGAAGKVFRDELSVSEKLPIN